MATQDHITEIVVAAARSGLAVNIGALRGRERCQQQQRAVARGFVEIILDTNKYGHYVRPQSNLVNGGQRISPNFATEAEADQWARDYVAQDPARRSYWQWEGSGIGQRVRVLLAGTEYAET